jgi:hypothetical protein
MGELLTGGAIAVFAFLLAIVWDVLKSERERGRRDRAVIAASDAEISTLSVMVLNNRNLVLMELNLLRKGKAAGLTNPLDPIPSGFWDLVKLDPPQALLRDEETLAKIRDISRRTDQVTEMIRSREAFRTTNRSLPSYDKELRQYDELLETFLGELLNALNALHPLIKGAAK